MFITDFEDSFVYILFLNSNLIVTRIKINLYKVARVNQAIHEILNLRQWIPILNYCLIECTIINSESKRTILFVYKEYKYIKKRYRRINIIFV